MSVNQKGRLIWKHSRLVLVGLILMIIASTFTAVSQVAATGSIYITPANPSVAHNGNITLSLRINPTTPVTVVQATVNFDPAALQYVSIDSSASPFDSSIQQTVSSSSIQIARAKLDPAGVSTDSLIANITFKALPYTGSSPVTLTNANAAYNGSYINPSATGSTVNFTPGSCPSGQVGTPPNCTTPAPTGGGGTTTPPKTTTPAPTQTTTPATQTPASTPTTSTLGVPTIQSEDISYTLFSVVAKTNVAAQSRLVYGVSSDKLNVQTDLSKSGTTQTMSVTEGLSPGSQLFYKVVSTDGKATKESSIRSITLKGLSVKVALFDKNIKTIPNQKVTLIPSNMEGTSDGNGIAVFGGLSPGDYTIQIVANGQTHQQHITVLSNVETSNGIQSSAQQSLAVIFDSYITPLPSSMLWLWIILGAIVALLIFLYWSWRKNGIVRTWYTQLTNYWTTRKLKHVTPGEFALTTGLDTTPKAKINKSSDIASASANEESVKEEEPSEALDKYAATHFNPFEHQGGSRHE